jgi:5-methyltetrahydrofolate--homocysteine methyltransferase
MTTLLDLRSSVIEGNAERAKTLVDQAIKEDLPAARILNEGLIDGMKEVGRLFECGEFFVPEMLVAGRAMKAGLERLRPKLAASSIQPIGKVVIGTVQGDLHDIGKNLVAMMLEGSGFEVVDLGVDVSPQKYVEAVKQHRPNLVGLSALLTTTMPQMKLIIEALEEAGLRSGVRIMIGGAPITAEFAQQIRADIFAPDAASAAARAKQAVA